MLSASVGFLLMSQVGMELHREVSGLVTDGVEQAEDSLKLMLLEQFREEQFYRLIGSSCVGLWALGLGLGKFRISRIPIVSAVLLIISGPVLIFFNWHDADHLGRTAAMAGIIIGVMILCVRLINKGLSE